VVIGPETEFWVELNVAPAEGAESGGLGETLPAMAVSLAVSAALIALGSLIFTRQEL